MLERPRDHDLPLAGARARTTFRWMSAAYGVALMLSIFVHPLRVPAGVLSIVLFACGVVSGLVWLVAEFRAGARGPTSARPGRHTFWLP